MTIPEEMMAVFRKLQERLLVRAPGKLSQNSPAKPQAAVTATSEHEAVAEKLSDVQEALHGRGLYGRNG